MTVQVPGPDQMNLAPPTAEEVLLISRGMMSATAGPAGLSQTQHLLIAAICHAMTGFPASFDAEPITAEDFGIGLAHRNLAFRSRIVQLMVLQALVLRPIPVEVVDQIARFASQLGVDEDMLGVAQGFAEGHLGLAAFDFERNGYAGHLPTEAAPALHARHELASPWDFDLADADLAGRWAALEKLPEGSLGRSVAEFYQARGFTYPGRPGSAPPLLAQHDWVHVVADFGTTVESELEVFALIARANDDLRGFSLLAMVVSLFETGYLRTGAGLFESDTGHLSRQGMATRVADAMRRGALCDGSVDFLATDWFELAAEPVTSVRRHFGMPPKSDEAVAAGSVGPWEVGGISPYQVKCGQNRAAELGIPYESYGAQVAPPVDQ